MVKRKLERRDSIIVISFILILSLAGMSLASDGSEELLNQAKQIFGSLPQVMASDKNPVTPQKVKLGKMLFYETRISVDGTVSCAKCHPFSLYAADGLTKSIGNNCKINPRNAPIILNAAGQIAAHWIGNRTDVEDQAKQSVIGPPSFGMTSYEAVEKKLKEIEGYALLFEDAYPGEKNPVSVDNFAKAVGAFERTLVTPSRFDLFANGDQAALTESQKRGLKTFIETGCITCHSGPYVGGQMYQKFGVFTPYWQCTKSKEVDDGRYAVTKNERDKYVFKVPILRNVEMTSPYFHDGSAIRLQDAIQIMGKAQLGKTLVDQQLQEIGLFLKSLTGQIPDDALKVPVLPPSE